MSFTVTAAQVTAKASGMSMTLKVVTGAAGSPVAGSAGKSGTSGAQNIAYTPTVINSLIFGALMGLSGTWTAESANSPFYQNSAAGGVQLIQFVTSSASSSTSTPLTLGATTSQASRVITVLEIAPGSGSLAIDASSPSPTLAQSAETLTTAAFTPPAGSLLVLMISSNGGAGAETFTVSDTSGLGLTWSETREAPSNFGYVGFWTAKVPVTGTASAKPPKMRLAASGAESIPGTGGGRLPKQSLAASAAESIPASGSVRLPRLALAGTAAEVFSGAASLRLPGLSVAGSGSEIFPASGAPRLPKPSLSGAATVVNYFVPDLLAGASAVPSLSGEASVTSTLEGSACIG